MSWICNNCSSYNPNDKNNVCYVCNAKRSRAEIKRSRQEERERRFELIKVPLYNAFHKIGIIVFFVGLISYIVFALISLYLIMQGGMLNDVVIRIIHITRGAIGKIVSVYNVNCKSLINSIVNAPALGSLKVNYVEMRLGILATISSLEVAIKILISAALEKHGEIINICSGIGNQIAESSSVLLSIITTLSMNFQDRTAHIIANIGVLFVVVENEIQANLINTHSVIEHIVSKTSILRDYLNILIVLLKDKLHNILNTILDIVLWVSDRVEGLITNIRFLIQKASERFLQFKDIEFN